MARKLGILVCAVLVAALVAPAMAGQFPDMDAKMKYYKAKEKAAGDYAAKARAEAAKARVETNANDAKEKAAAAGAAKAAKVSADARAKQDKVCKVIGFVPVVGLTMRLYNSGEMKACLTGMGNESYYGVKHVFFKLPAALPEHAATDFVYQFTGSDWRELDPVTVFLVDGRPYWMDGFVIAAKITMPILASYAVNGLPYLATRWELIGNAFLWQAAVGGGLNVLTGIGSQAAEGLSPYRQYYKDFQRWTGKPATVPALL